MSLDGRSPTSRSKYSSVSRRSRSLTGLLRDGAATTLIGVCRRAERSAIAKLGPALADVPGVAEAYSVTGEFDFVVIVRVKNHEEIADVVTSRLSQVPGIVKTHTHVAFKVYSKHDLEAMFSVGLQEAR